MAKNGILARNQGGDRLHEGNSSRRKSNGIIGAAAIALRKNNGTPAQHAG